MKRWLYPRIHRFTAPVRPTIRDKTDRDDELAFTIPLSPPAFWKEYPENSLRTTKYNRHKWLSTLKYVEIDGERFYERSSWVYWPDGILGKWQHHCYVIQVPDEVRIYHHKEPSISRPRAHQDGSKQVPGDPDGHLKASLREIDAILDTFSDDED